MSALSESTSGNALAANPAEDLSPIEQDILDEYERLAENMKKVSALKLIRELAMHALHVPQV